MVDRSGLFAQAGEAIAALTADRRFRPVLAEVDRLLGEVATESKVAVDGVKAELDDVLDTVSHFANAVVGYVPTRKELELAIVEHTKPATAGDAGKPKVRDHVDRKLVLLKAYLDKRFGDLQLTLRGVAYERPSARGRGGARRRLRRRRLAVATGE